MGKHIPRCVLTILIFFLFALCASAEWRVSIESKSVYAGETGVGIAFDLAFDKKLAGLAIPVIVHELTPGSFWKAPLPYDSGGFAF